MSVLDRPNAAKAEISSFVQGVAGLGFRLASTTRSSSSSSSLAMFAPSLASLTGFPLVYGVAAPRPQGQRHPLPLQNAFRRPDSGILRRYALRALPAAAKTSMEPELAPLMSNLALVHSDLSAPRKKVVLDPFVGAGLLLLASALQNPHIIALGSDAQQHDGENQNCVSQNFQALQSTVEPCLTWGVTVQSLTSN